MCPNLYFPSDDFSSADKDYDLAADYLELSAFFSQNNQALTSDLINASEISAEDDYSDVNEEVIDREEIVSAAVKRISSRATILGEVYPFKIDDNGDVLYFNGIDNLSLGCASYLLCLILSHLKSVSPVLTASSAYPSDSDIILLRRYFQYFATAAMAAEIGGGAWSFGHPRPDQSGFIQKLEEIWGVIRDGKIEIDSSAPTHPQDDQIDIFAWRGHPDNLPGFLFAGAQVATGKNWKDKSIKSHLRSVFWDRWFGKQPVSQMVCYHIIPFTRPDSLFRDDVTVLGNVLHRLRVPYRVQEAESLQSLGVQIEAFNELPNAVDWIKNYRSQHV